MPQVNDINRWVDTVRSRYESYLKTSFYFKDPELRESFRSALQADGELLKGPYPEMARGFRTGARATDLAVDYFASQYQELAPALLNDPLYAHQERAIRSAHAKQQNIVVATGTASGKTECFLYPILFELYRQHLNGRLREPGVRAMVLYPMNALANDQRIRLGEICGRLRDEDSGFEPTFGQYIGQTPVNPEDERRNAARREEERQPGELIFRNEMRDKPPHILLTNYSMLEYLLIRPEDSPIFDGDSGRYWQFIVLDEAHQYRGAKGIEMGMLVRRLKQRLREGGRQGDFRCIGTSATLVSGDSDDDKQAVANFAAELFGEPFSKSGVVFAEHEKERDAYDDSPRRHHAFLRALEGAFLVNENGKDSVTLNRKKSSDDGTVWQPLEIALCRECGQHYYVGRAEQGVLSEAIRDPSHSNFGMEYYLPVENNESTSFILCRRCGRLSKFDPSCGCGASVPVKKCNSHQERPDQLKECEACGYQRGGIGDPVQEIVHGSDGPNAVVATALHELLPDDRRKVLAFADSRQEAAFFAWYAEDSYQKLRDRNLILRALRDGTPEGEGLSIDDLQNRLATQWDRVGMFRASDTREARERNVLTSILAEALTDERRLSLSGVGLAKWFVEIPDTLVIPDTLLEQPWGLTVPEAYALLQLLLDECRIRSAMALPDDSAAPQWVAVSPERRQRAFSNSPPRGRRNVSQWGAPQSALVKHYLSRLLDKSGLPPSKRQRVATDLMKEVWNAIRKHDQSQPFDDDHILKRADANGTFRLNPRWLRVQLASVDKIWECDVCANINPFNIRSVCTRNRCPGNLKRPRQDALSANHYRLLYESDSLPPKLNAQEHTAQIDSELARERQEHFKSGQINLLSSSTTFEVGVDLGDLEVAFLRNVPPEPFNYTQRVGRAGRRENPGLAVTYCRRNPHDLYHFADPEMRVIKGQVQPPRLNIRNEKIISRHVTAIALSSFFKKTENQNRFNSVADFVGNWENSRAVADLVLFCRNNTDLKESIRAVVPESMHDVVGLNSDRWIDWIAGEDSQLDRAVAEVSSDQQSMERLRKELYDQHKSTGRVERRISTITGEQTLDFLSRKAVIPKYGFPVDVVELDTRPENRSAGVSLQRDLSQAIAEYAPGGKVVANKREWQSCGVKTLPGKHFPVKRYEYSSPLDFSQWSEGESRDGSIGKKYLQPVFGFVTPLFEKPVEPRRRSQRLYTTRPFFEGFNDPTQIQPENLFGVGITKAMPGTLVILCEGKRGRGFYICVSCGSHMTERKPSHKSPDKRECNGSLDNYSLGHELETDVIRMQFPDLINEWNAYSLAYAIALGAAETMDVPDTDLNVTITSGNTAQEAAIVLYDNVPGGAGLVAQIERPDVFKQVINNAHERVAGGCGCDSSCYGCLRSYRNQFAHPYLDRIIARGFLAQLPVR